MTTLAYAQLEGKFTLEKSVFAAGEPIWLTFQLKNPAKENLYFIAGDTYYNSGYCLRVFLGKPGAHSNCGNNCNSGGPASIRTIPARGQLTDKLLLNFDHDLAQPGQYYLKATRGLHTSKKSNPREMADSNENIFEQEFDIEITPPDEAALSKQLAPYVAQLNSPKDDVVREAARVLSSSAPAYLESTMLSMLQRPTTREFAIKGLEKINTQPARQALAKLAIEYVKEYSYDREQAVRALSEMGDRTYFPLLKQIADSQPPNQSREATIYAATLGGDDAILWLASKLHDGNPFTAGAVVWALPATGSRRAVPMLIDLLVSPEKGLGEAAEIALVQLTHRSISPGSYGSRTPQVTHEAWVRWWSSHPDAPVYGPKLCGEILPLN